MRDQTQRRRQQKLRIEAGAEVLRALEDPNVVEVMLNPDGRLWVEVCGQGMFEVGHMTPLNAEALIGTVADALGIVATRETPIVEGEFPLDGSRFEGLLPPIVSAPAFTLRKRPQTIFTLADYVRQGVMDEDQRKRIACAVSTYENILVIGGTGSGKTTLTNAIIDGIATAHPEDRLVIIEDTAEIQCRSENAVILRSTVDVSMERLLRATMRLRPDRILVGEVRGAEALAPWVELRVLDQNIDTSDATGRLLFNMLGAIGQFETEIHAERQREGIDKAKAHGVRFGPKRRLSDQQVRDLRRKREEGSLIKELMAEYELSKASIYLYLSSKSGRAEISV